MMTETDEYLSEHDVRRLTGKMQAKLQRAELEKRRIPFLVDAHGHPLVSRHHARQIAAGEEVVSSSGPNWGAVR